MDFINNRFLGNSVSTWILAVVVGLLVVIVTNWLKDVIRARLTSDEKPAMNSTKIFIGSLLQRTGKLFILALGLYISSLILILPERIHIFLRTSMIVVALLQIAFWGGSLIDYLVNRRLQGEADEKAAEATSLNALKLVAKIALWTLVILLVLENLTGVEINALIASLGVTGVAVALAVQNILGDLFASLSIALDKPFVIGDSIMVDEFSGTVEHIGLKSTRVRSINGEQVVFSNSDLLNSRLQNFKSMKRRRVAFIAAVQYETPLEKLERIPYIVQEIVQPLQDITLDRVHLKDVGGGSLNYEIVYYVETPDVYRYMDLQQSINLELLRRFAQEGIEFAYPTQAVIIAKTK
jgi:small-conductance mechanosensitive channel